MIFPANEKNETIQIIIMANRYFFLRFAQYCLLVSNLITIMMIREYPESKKTKTEKKKFPVKIYIDFFLLLKKISHHHHHHNRILIKMIIIVFFSYKDNDNYNVIIIFGILNFNFI